MPSLAGCVQYISSMAETVFGNQREGRSWQGTRTDKTPHLLKTPFDATATEYQSRIVREGKGVPESSG